MLRELTAGMQVYLVTGYTDLRRSIDGLAEIVQSELHLDPFSTAFFCSAADGVTASKDCSGKAMVFCCCTSGWMMAILNGHEMETEAMLLTPQQTRWLLEGLNINQPKAIKDGKPGEIY